jgi:transketolase
MIQLMQLTKRIRRDIIRSTTAAGSGHPSSSLSATDLMATLLFGGHFRADLDNPEYPNNDRLIFSKGHAAPLFYALYAAAGKVSNEELLTLRKIDSNLEGHPTRLFPYTEVPTGSLGQGLSVGVGMALYAKSQKLSYKTYVLLGDSEMAEGQVWEAMQLAAHYKLNNLLAILDVNKLGQRGETMYGHDVKSYQKKAAAFGWDTIVIDGHSLKAIDSAYTKASKSKNPCMIIAKTIKGKGVKMIENKEGWHGKALSEKEATVAIKQFGAVEDVIGKIKMPVQIKNAEVKMSRLSGIPLVAGQNKKTNYQLPVTNYTKPTATRHAYGNALVTLGKALPNLVVLDAETSNSTGAEIFKKADKKRFFEMFIAEQNMVSTALGMSRRGAVPFCSTFAAFFTRAYDQIRMAAYADTPLVLVGSHSGVSIGSDGASQMALEDIAIMRAIEGGIVLYPSDAVATERLVFEAAQQKGVTYIRTTRTETPILYSQKEQFPVGGSKTLRSSNKDVATIFAAGITVHEALKAYEELKSQGVLIRVVDMYSIKPLDVEVIKKACAETTALLVSEDHHREGGLYEAICGSGAVTRQTYSLAVNKRPHSGGMEELLRLEEIDAQAIVKKVTEIL